jgi:hypothetical protein
VRAGCGTVRARPGPAGVERQPPRAGGAASGAAEPAVPAGLNTVRVDAGAAYETLVGEFVAAGTAPAPRGGNRFGAGALTAGGSIFAMLTRGQLVLKLPRERVAALIADGTGEPFTAGKGRPMAEWIAIRGTDLDAWRALAGEAHRFVAKQG